MVDEDKILQDFFSASFEHQSLKSNDAEDWVFIQKNLSRNRFFRFSLSGFNIYYAIAILLSFLFSAAVGIDYLFFIKERENKLIDSVQNQNGLEETKEVKETSNSINFQTSKIVPKVAVPQKKSKEQNFATVKPGIVMPDTMKKASDTVDEASEYPPVPEDLDSVPENLAPEVKRIIMYKQDTIINYDSVKVKKGFLFFKK